MIELPAAAVVLCVIAGLFFLGLWLYYDRRDHRLFEGERRRAAFHCLRCDALYSACSSPTASPCPKCGHVNQRLKF